MTRYITATVFMVSILVCVIVSGYCQPGKHIFGWRGDGTGRFPQSIPPTEWDVGKGKNILWQTKVGESFSSPIITGNRIFVTCETEELVCLNRADGKILWRKTNDFDDLPAEMKVEEKRFATSCGFSTPTPVTDGVFVYASFGTGIVACYDLEGKRKWIRHFPFEQVTEDGRSASPVLSGNKLLVTINHLFALEAKTGKTLWAQKEAGTSYGTPALAKIGDVDVVITPGGYCLRVADGKMLAKDIGEASYSSPVVHKGVVYFLDYLTTAVKLPEKAGEKIQPKSLWEVDLEGEFFSSPVCHEGLLYGVNNEGIFYGMDSQKGEIVYQKPLVIGIAGGGNDGNLYASITLAGNYLFLANDVGEHLIVAPGKEYRQVAQNALDEGSGATPVFAGKHLFLRDGEKLYCIGKE